MLKINPNIFIKAFFFFKKYLTSIFRKFWTNKFSKIFSKRKMMATMV